MKVACTIISVQVDSDEWNKINAEWEKIIYGDLPKKIEWNELKALRRFMTNIQTVANNKSHIIDHKLDS